MQDKQLQCASPQTIPCARISSPLLSASTHCSSQSYVSADKAMPVYYMELRVSSVRAKITPISCSVVRNRFLLFLFLELFHISLLR